LLDAIDNNRDAGRKIAAECAAEIGPIIAEGLAAMFVTVEEAPPEPEDLCPSADTQDDTADKVIALIQATTTVARVNRILKANAPRMLGWNRGNFDAVTHAGDFRLEELQMGGHAR
jgi:hypothetical protein